METNAPVEISATPEPTPSQQARVISGMNEDKAVGEVLSFIQVISKGMDKYEVDRRYRLGERVSALKNTYGKQSIEKLAALSGWSKSSLYADAAVSQGITNEELGRLHQFAGQVDGRLSWTQMQLIAAVSGKLLDEDRDENVISLCLAIAAGLSAREVKAEIASLKGVHSERLENVPELKLESVTKRFVKELRQVHLADYDEETAKRVGAALAEAAEEIERVRKLLDQAGQDLQAPEPEAKAA